MSVKNTSSVLVINVTPKGIVVRFDSLFSEDSVLCFLSAQRAKQLGVVVPTDTSKVWLKKTATARKVEGAFAKYQAEGTHTIEGKVRPFPLFIQGEKWIVEDRDFGTPAEKQWQGLKLVD